MRCQYGTDPVLLCYIIKLILSVRYVTSVPISYKTCKYTYLVQTITFAFSKKTLRTFTIIHSKIITNQFFPFTISIITEQSLETI